MVRTCQVDGAPPPSPRCVVDDCDDLVESAGLCCSHYNRWKAYGNALAGRKRRAPAGSGGIDSHGYRVVTVDGRHTPSTVWS